jgi:Tfp pilus assembly protein PilF
MVSSSPSSAQTAAEKTAAELTELELAQLLAERLAIKPNDWHRLNRDRKVRAKEQLAAALVYLIKQQPQEAQVRVEQALGWLDKSLTAPPCPTHGERKAKS